MKFNFLQIASKLVGSRVTFLRFLYVILHNGLCELSVCDIFRGACSRVVPFALKITRSRNRWAGHRAKHAKSVKASAITLSRGVGRGVRRFRLVHEEPASWCDSLSPPPEETSLGAL